MGIRKLFTFLDNKKIFEKHSYLDEIIKNLGINKNKFVIAVDGNLYCYKYSYSYDDMIIGFYNQILKFFSKNIIPLYIFDGGVVKEKESTNINRNKKININKEKINKLDENNDNFDDMEIIKKKLEKKSIKITKFNLKPLLELFDLMNIPFIFSHCEGEYLAVLLNKLGIVDMFLTDDTDPIPAGINNIVKFYKNSVYFLNYDDMLKSLELTKSEFIDFCILMGCDYNNFFHKINPNELYENIKKYHSIENMIEYYTNNDNTNDELFVDEYDGNAIISTKLLICDYITIDDVNKIRNIYNNLYNYERESFINLHSELNFDINEIVNHDDLSNYSNIMLEHWEEFIEILKINNYKKNENSENFKEHINNFIKNKKFNINEILKFMRKNVKNISDEEIDNISITFKYLNEFGITS